MRWISTKLRSLLRERDGNVIVEFAFLLPAFLTMILVLLEVGNYLWVRNTVDHAARESARFGMVRGPWGTQWAGSASTLETAMETYAVARITGSNLLSSKATADATVDVTNRTINLTLSYNYVPMIVPTTVIPSGTISTTATMDIQRP